MKFKSLFFTAMAASIGFTSCSNDVNLDQEANRLQKGDPTYAHFSIQLAGQGTRVSNEDCAVAEEQKISTISIYIFSGGVLETTSKPTIENNTTVPIAVTTGTKTVYAVTNSDLGSAIDSEVTVESTTISQFEEIIFDAKAQKIASENNFAMLGVNTNAAIVKCTEAEALVKNKITITIDRAAAKVLVKYNEPTVADHIKASFSDAYFGIAQSTTQMYVKLDETLSRYTPLGTFETTQSGTYPLLESVPEEFGEDYFYPCPAENDNKFSANKYTGECIVENPTTGNTTFALVRVKCTPDALYNNETLSEDGTFWVAAKNYSESATWVFCSDNDLNIIYFASEDDAAAYITAQGLESQYQPYEYAQGLCYYRVNLKNSEELVGSASSTITTSQKYRVTRNNYYRIYISAIKALGAPSGSGVVPTDPDTPLEQDSWMAAEIDITPWTTHDMEEVLE